MVEWKDLEIFLAKRNLYNVLKAIEVEPKSLTRISKETGIRFEHVSRYVKELVELGYITNLTPGITKGKVFEASEPGMAILGEIKNKKLFEKE